MKPTKGIISLLLLAAPAMSMAQKVDRLGLTGIDISRNAESLRIEMTVSPSSCRLGTDRLMTVTPVLRSADGADSIRLTPYSIAGKNQYYYTIRSNSRDGKVYRSGSHNSDSYSADVPWQDWMAESTMEFDISTSACCGAPVGEEQLPVADLNFEPPVIPVTADLEYLEPAPTAVKEYALEGRAYVNFPVNRTEIYFDYLNNPLELKKITNSIDTVRDNKDATIQSITLTGYASPEGPYSNNVRLAKGRTEAVRDYVSRLYDFAPSAYITSSVPEDWAGLREAVEKSVFPMRDRMLDFIDSDYPIEKRNDRFRQLFPTEYEWFLKNVYPWLRHTDYLIKYTIRHYSDVEEIRKVMATRPQNLSLDEFYLLAKSYPVGSREYDEVFDVAVRMYPEEQIANLNAANAALSRGDLVGAERFLLKAGNGADADYARGMYYAKKKDYDKAVDYLEKCGTNKARAAIDRINIIRNFEGTVLFRPISE